MKSNNITNHGLLIDSINYKELIKAQASTKPFITKSRKVVSAKPRTKVRRLVKK